MRGQARRSPVLVQRARSHKDGAGRPGALLARRMRTVKLCSPGTRARLGALGVGRVRMLRAVKSSLGHSSKEKYRELEGPRWTCAVEAEFSAAYQGSVAGVMRIVMRAELLYIQLCVYVGHPEGHCQFRETRRPIRRGSHYLRRCQRARLGGCRPFAPGTAVQAAWFFSEQAALARRVHDTEGGP